MGAFDFDWRWQELSEEVVSGMKEWRLAHPRATLREIEAALDERLGRMRARMLEDAALASAAAAWEERAEDEPPVCPECGQRLKERGAKTRQVQTRGGQTLERKRQYGVCPACKSGLFPPG